MSGPSFCETCPMRGDMHGESSVYETFQEEFKLDLARFASFETLSRPIVEFRDQDGARSEQVVLPDGVPADNAVSFVSRRTETCEEPEKVGFIFNRRSICPALEKYAKNRDQRKERRG